jgi:hypothetical protein
MLKIGDLVKFQNDRKEEWNFNHIGIIIEEKSKIFSREEQYKIFWFFQNPLEEIVTKSIRWYPEENLQRVQ